MKYDALKAPDPKDWQALDEDERVALVKAYHRKMRIRPPRARLHAAVHTTVENQCALGDETPVRNTLERLQQEGLDRHEAVHAVGSVLVSYLNDLFRSPLSVSDPNAIYFEQVRRLTAIGWRQQFADDS